MQKRHILKITLSFFTLHLLSACSQFGPKAIEASRTDYNIAMHRTEEEQALLNLVRLRYGDRPYFLEATALNTQFSFAPSVDLGATINPESPEVYRLGGKFAYEEKPTISYAPLTGEAFVRQVLSRISLETMLLLDSSGWKTDRVLRLCVEKLNNLDNASKASGPTPSVGPDTSKFKRAIALLSGFLDRQEMQFLSKKVDDKVQFVALFSAAAMARDEYRQFASLLDIDPTIGEYSLSINQLNNDKKTIRFTTRSFMGVLYFLSQGVDVPEKDVTAGLVAQTKTAAGAVFDWQTVTNGLLKIHSQPKPQQASNVSVNYRGSWFYIDDTDIESKSTFALLSQLYALQSKNDGSGTPILTLPIGN